MAGVPEQADEWPKPDLDAAGMDRRVGELARRVDAVEHRQDNVEAKLSRIEGVKESHEAD